MPGRGKGKGKGKKESPETARRVREAAERRLLRSLEAAAAAARRAENAHAEVLRHQRRDIGRGRSVLPRQVAVTRDAAASAMHRVRRAERTPAEARMTALDHLPPGRMPAAAAAAMFAPHPPPARSPLRRKGAGPPRPRVRGTGSAPVRRASGVKPRSSRSAPSTPKGTRDRKKKK